MTISAGINCVIQVSASASTGYSGITRATSISTSGMARDLLDASHLGTIYKNRIYGLMNGSLSVTCDYNESAGTQTLIRTSYVNRSDIWIQFMPDGSTGFNVQCLVSEFSFDVSVDGKITWSATFEFNGLPDTTIH